MFKRFRDSLVYPKKILNYRKDHLFFVLLYLLFFAILLSSGTVIDVIKHDGLESVYKASIEEEMTVVTQDCEILDAQLICAGEYFINLYEEPIFAVYLFSEDISNFSEYPSANYSFVINEDKVYIYIAGINSLTIQISDLPTQLQNIDFDDQINDSSAFYNNLFSGVDELLMGYKNMWGPLMIGVEIIISSLFYLIFILVSAWFLKMRYKVIPFKETFTLVTYSSTSIFVILTFYSMLDLSLFVILILLVISFRQNGIMSREIERRLKKKS